MAQTPDTFDIRYGDGVTTEFTFDFPYLEQDDVYVEVDGVPTGFTFLLNNTIELAAAPADGAEVYIYRNTPAATPAYEFNLGAPFLPKYIDRNFTQLLYAVQEGLDFYQQLESQVIRVTDADGLEPLPLAAERAGKFLSFDENGDPVVKVPSENTAEGLGAALASTAEGFGASLVGMQGGPTVEVAVKNRIKRPEGDTRLVPGYNPGSAIQIYDIISGVSDNMHRHFGSICRTQSGKLIIVYRYSQEHGVIPGQTSSIRMITNTSEGSEGEWSAEVEIVPAESGRYQQGPSIGVSESGRVFVFWADIRDDSVDANDGVSGTYFYVI